MIGVGKLGQDCAEVMADAGYDVVGYDIEPRNPSFPMKETIQDSVIDRDIIFIAAPTPHDPIYGGETPTSHLPNKDFDYTIVKGILEEVNKYVTQNQLVVLISTVLPGTVRSLLRPCITNARFIYNPYLIAMGTIKWDMVNPEMVIIGTEDGSITGDAKELIEFYQAFMQNDPRYEVGTWDEAESIKIFYNTFISTKLALVNMIQDVAETNGNINVDVVTTALAKSTHRIMGPAYMKAGLGDAGACHPRDNIALRYLAERLNLGYDLFDSIMTAREIQAERMALRCLKNGKNVTIIGKAYKPAVPYTNGSASMLVGYYIEKHGGNLHYYDPNTGDNDLRAEWTDVYLIGYWEDWVEKLKFEYREKVIIDPWRRILPKHHHGEIIHYGDTRSKERYVVPNTTVASMKQQVYDIFPGLGQYDNVIHLIDATINMDTTFVLRPTEDLVEELREAKRQGKLKFIFFAPTEAFMAHVMGKIHRLVELIEEIDYKDVFFVSGVADGDETYEKICKKMGWTKKINLLNSAYCDYITTTYARGYEYIGGYEVRHKGKTFTCFNKLHREHRLRLVNKMLGLDLVKDSYYSFEGEFYFVQSIPTLNDELYSNIKANAQLFPMRLNITPERNNPVNIQPDDLIYYRDSYFSLVTETLFYGKDYPNQHHRPYVEDSIFITEKTYRCFALLHPFVLMGRPHLLKQLRKEGYKTFSPFIDESYDSIENDDERFEAICAEVLRLSKFNGNDWIAWQEGIREIVEFNKEHFHTKRKFSFTDNYLELFLDAPAQSYEPPVNILTDFSVSVNNVDTEPSVELTNDIQPDNLISTEGFTTSLDWRNQERVLDSGIKLNFPQHVDGAGEMYCEELLALIDRTGKEKYSRALDWCAGYGPFGFELLDKKRADFVVFQDIYDVAINTCVTNALENNLSSQIGTYICSKISDLPENEKFDLVVGNPPHSNTSMYLEKNVLFENTKRLIVDENHEIHKEFLQNIYKYLINGADIYFTAGSTFNSFIQWAVEGNLNFQNYYENKENNCIIYHFKFGNNE